MKEYIVFLLLLLPASLSSADRIAVPSISNEEQSALVYTIGRIELADGELRLVDKQGFILYAEPISRVRSVVISGGTENTEITLAPTIAVYPNPTSAILHIQNVDEDVCWRIYDLQGRLVQNGTGADVYVEALEQGDYLLQVKTSITKFIKQ